MSAGYGLSEDDKKQRFAIVQTNRRAVVESGDPEVPFNAGTLLADSQCSPSPLTGGAVPLAACDLG